MVKESHLSKHNAVFLFYRTYPTFERFKNSPKKFFLKYDRFSLFALLAKTNKTLLHNYGLCGIFFTYLYLYRDIFNKE